jgi:hypothetical protein
MAINAAVSIVPSKKRAAVPDFSQMRPPVAASITGSPRFVVAASHGTRVIVAIYLSRH